MELNAPTFHSLNKPQKRALILRDQLRYLDTRHLDTFIEGIGQDEPPLYRKVNGSVQPPLTVVHLRDTASRFDLGNVHFTEAPVGIRRAYLTVEDDRVELRTEEPLPADDTNLESVPIHVFIAKTMIPMFETKCKAIHARQTQINEIRIVAYNICSRSVEPFQTGETLAQLGTDAPATNTSAPKSLEALNKRKAGQPIVKHVSNKRRLIGLDTIPGAAKTAAFNIVPNQIKVDLFNNIIKTAFPNFDNLMVASWNVVSIYSNVGTDFPELHKAIGELKSVLQDFEGSFQARGAPTELGSQDVNAASSLTELVGTAPTNAPGSMVTRSEPQDTAMNTPPKEASGRTEQTAQPKEKTPVLSNSSVNITSQPNMIPLGAEETTQQQPKQEDLGTTEVDERPTSSPEQGHKTPDSNSLFIPENPRDSPLTRSRRSTPETPSRNPIPPRTKIAKTGLKPSEITASPSPKPKDKHASPELLRRRTEYAKSLARSSSPQQQPRDTSTTTNTATSIPTSQPSPPNQHQMQTKSLASCTISELRQIYKDRKAEITSRYGFRNVPQYYKTQLAELAEEIRKREGESGDSSGGGGSSGGEKGLGTSMLTPKKGGSGAPVATTLHTRGQ